MQLCVCEPLLWNSYTSARVEIALSPESLAEGKALASGHMARVNRPVSDLDHMTVEIQDIFEVVKGSCPASFAKNAT